MTADALLLSSRVLIVAGKGGVGKTTVGATIGLAAARAGLSCQLIELDGRTDPTRPFGVDELGSGVVELHRDGSGGQLTARHIRPDLALADYLVDHGIRIGGRLARMSAVELVSNTAPGIRDLLTLGRIRSLETAGEADLLVVDAPAAGHAISFLRSPTGLAASATSGPVHDQAVQALEFLGDAKRCRVVLVTLPEETPVVETVETAFTIEDELGVALGPVVVNGRWSTIDGLDEVLDDERRGPLADARRDAAEYRLGRIERQDAEIARLAEELPLRRIVLPQRFTTRLDVDDLGVLADHLVAA